MAAEATICTQCGYNTSTGKTYQTVVTAGPLKIARRMPPWPVLAAGACVVVIGVAVFSFLGSDTEGEDASKTSAPPGSGIPTTPAAHIRKTPKTPAPSLVGTWRWTSRKVRGFLVLEDGGRGWVTLGDVAYEPRAKEQIAKLTDLGFARHNIWCPHPGGGTGGVVWSGSASALTVRGHQDGLGQVSGKLASGALRLRLDDGIYELRRR